MLRSEIKGADSGNAIALDNISILYASSKLTLNEEGNDLQNSEEFLNLSKEIEDHDYIASSAWHLTCYITDVVAYIAGFVVKCLKKCVTCAFCLLLLQSDITPSLLQQRKQYGQLHRASSFLIKICSVGETCLRFMKLQKTMSDTNFHKI